MGSAAIPRSSVRRWEVQEFRGAAAAGGKCGNSAEKRLRTNGRREAEISAVLPEER